MFASSGVLSDMNNPPLGVSTVTSATTNQTIITAGAVPSLAIGSMSGVGQQFVFLTADVYMRRRDANGWQSWRKIATKPA